MDKLMYVKQYYPAARMAGELYGMDPVVILAQSAIETGWGESLLARQSNNFFGLAGYGVTNAYWKGGKTDLGDEGGLLFRTYAEAEHSFLDFARMLTVVYPWAPRLSYYPEAYAREMAYATSVSRVNEDNRDVYRRLLSGYVKRMTVMLKEQEFVKPFNNRKEYE